MHPARHGNTLAAFHKLIDDIKLLRETWAADQFMAKWAEIGDMNDITRNRVGNNLRMPVRLWLR